MPSLNNHQSNDFVKILLIGDAQCLAGDTIVSVTRGNSRGKSKTLGQLYQSDAHHNFDPSLETYLLSDVGGYVGFNLVDQVVYSGIKEVYALQADDRIVKATLDHKFLTDNGWIELRKLSAGTKIRVWDRHALPSKGQPRRNIVYSIPYHPYAYQHMISGFDYKRAPFARIVLEADLNKLTVAEYINIIRNSRSKAAALEYLPRTWDVHHKDGDCTNDALDNLEAIPESEHHAKHALEKTISSKSLSWRVVSRVDKVGPTDTYDVSMATAHKNFIANNIVVHNSGKTGSLCSLVKAGYKLRILDLDNKLDVLKYFVQHECPDKISNVEFRTIRDRYQMTAAGPMISGMPKAFIETIKMLDKWEDLGKPADWGSDTILVVDSLSRFCDSAYDWRLPLAPKGKSGEIDTRAVYGDAQDAVEQTLATLTSDGFRTNVIVICHVAYIDLPDGTRKGFPQGVGQKLSPKIPQYFPSSIYYTTKGGKRSIQTVSTALIDLANPAPFAMKDSYDIKTGLADFFAVLREPPKQEAIKTIRTNEAIISPPAPKKVTEPLNRRM